MDSGGEQDVAGPEGRAQPGEVAVVEQVGPFRVSADAAGLVRREGCPQPGHREAEAGPVERDDVGKPFRDRRVALAAHGVAGLVESVQLFALVEDRRLGRVDVLGRIGGGVEDAATETDRPLAQIVDREHEAPAKAVVRLLGSLARRKQAEFEQRPLLDPVPGRRGPERPPLIVRVAHPEVERLLQRQAASLEIVAGTGAGGFAQPALEPFGREGEHSAQRRMRVLALLLPVGNLDPDSRPHVAHRLRELEAEVLHHEAEDIPAFPAHEALEDLALRIDGEVRAVTAVQGAGSAVALSRSSKLDVLSDDLEDVRPRPDVLDEAVAHHDRTPRPGARVARHLARTTPLAPTRIPQP